MTRIDPKFTPRFTHERIAVGRTRFGHVEVLATGPAHALRALGHTPHNLGGSTTCELVDDSGEVVASATAECRWPEFVGRRMVGGDNFSKRIGRDIALGRAAKALVR